MDRCIAAEAAAGTLEQAGDGTVADADTVGRFCSR